MDEASGGSGEKTGAAGRTEHFSSDDSIEGEDVGIVMRKSVRSHGTAGFASLGRLSGSQGHFEERTRDDEGTESERAVGEIRDVFERLGIDVGDISGEGEEGLGIYGSDYRERESDEDVEAHSSEEEMGEEHEGEGEGEER